MGTRLSEKVAIVTGSASGIGRVIASMLASEGARVVVADCDPVGGHETVSRIQQMGHTAAFIAGDVSRATDTFGIAQFAVQQYGRLDVVVNNAAWVSEADAVELTECDWDRTIDVCLKSVFLMAKAAIPIMRERGGAIVNISSVNGIVTNPGFPAYSAAKAGMLGLTRNLALEFANAKIRVNAVCPGIIATERFLEIVNADPQESAMALESQPLQYWGTPEDVAWACVYLASDESKFITGATLVLDGGLTIQSTEAVVRPWFRKRWREGNLIKRLESL